MTTTYETTLDGRDYVVDVHPEKRNQPMYEYAQTYRLRKDGTRGRKLMPWRPEAMAVWHTIEDRVAT